MADDIDVITGEKLFYLDFLYPAEYEVDAVMHSLVSTLEWATYEAYYEAHAYDFLLYLWENKHIYRGRNTDFLLLGDWSEVDKKALRLFESRDEAEEFIEVLHRSYVPISYEEIVELAKRNIINADEDKEDFCVVD